MVIDKKEKIKLKKTLFWDVDIKDFDLNKHKDFIIDRIIEKGDLGDYNWMKNFYGESSIKERLAESRKLGAKSLNFWCFIYNIDKKKCIQAQSTRKQSLYWRK